MISVKEIIESGLLLAHRQECDLIPLDSTDKGDWYFDTIAKLAYRITRTDDRTESRAEGRLRMSRVIKPSYETLIAPEVTCIDCGRKRVTQPNNAKKVIRCKKCQARRNRKKDMNWHRKDRKDRKDRKKRKGTE